ncbi:class I tRNA ligase family protein [Candidatus Deianiraea vastatrix]|uniref:valine--tRNA ligase n=1 Tax=Candidatus Deianiraea vastatrix TaxID=2163644 RepID=A0A5B8XD95_9RICK|nr:class I tRNA ligase family protein [Candidatus Deianiraea vastatrix]QED22865.1 Valine--tRNA ligase [Candidatus Deianiraea vastatrix]
MSDSNYKFDAKDSNVFSIDTPPPTVSGHLHMGHVFSYCHADFIARFQRMSGKNVFYPIGFDDNGLPTERLVEKITGVKVGFKYSDKSVETLVQITRDFVHNFAQNPSKNNATLVHNLTGISVSDLEKFIKNDGEIKEKLLNFSGKKYDGICEKSQFIEICRIIVNDAEIEFEKLFRTINLSVDWDYKYQSISDNSAKIAQTTFNNLFEKGLIYTKHAPVYWCTADKTATANTEIEDKEMVGVQAEFHFTIENGDKLLVMSTRPEMIPACRALLFNPDDERFNGKKTGQQVVVKMSDGTEVSSIGIDLNGKSAIVPIGLHKVPILADKDVKIDKGTGVVMCCTYGDWQDVIWAKRHNLTEVIIIAEDGKVNAQYAQITKENGSIDSLKVEEARKKAVQIIENDGLLVSKKDISHPVKCAERSGRPLEIIPAQQWYIRVLPFKNILLEMSKLVNFHPQSMRIKLENWINGLSQDWCISRNRFFGIPVPVKSEANDEMQWNCINSDNFPLLVNENCPWVLDTWFTSGLSPHLSTILHENLQNDSLNLEKNPIRKNADPVMSLRPQAHEIIRTWTFVTLVQSYLNLGTKITSETSEIDIHASDLPIEIADKDYIIVKSGDKFLKCDKPNFEHLPWKDIMLSGWCLASDKTKMSKSKGNIVTPTDLIENFGCDAVRYWSGSSTLGADTPYSEGQIKVGQRLVTKLKNAAKLCMQTIETSEIKAKNHDEIIDIALKCSNEIDAAIIQKISAVCTKYSDFMAQFEYSKALDVVEKFFWTDFCDNYLELAKVRSYGLLAQIYSEKTIDENEKIIIIKGQNSVASVMYFVILRILGMFAVFLPNICDEIWQNSTLAQKVSGKNNRITSPNSRGFFAVVLENLEFSQAVIDKYDAITEILDAIRKAKSDANVSLKTGVKEIQIPERLAKIFDDIKTSDGIKDLSYAGIFDLSSMQVANSDEIIVTL